MDAEKVEIRGYSSADLESCRTLWFELTEAHRIIYDDPTIGGDDSGAYFDKHLEMVGSERIWIAEIDGEVVGMLGLMRNPHDGTSNVVEPIVVKKEHRGKEIGRKLLQHVIEEERRAGRQFLTIQPVARNVEAMKMFRDLGFKGIGNIDLVMELREEDKMVWKSGLKIHDLEFEY
jgi:GNAT superfamily N-acetyltransferase